MRYKIQITINILLLFISSTQDYTFKILEIKYQQLLKISQKQKEVQRETPGPEIGDEHLTFSMETS